MPIPKINSRVQPQSKILHHYTTDDSFVGVLQEIEEKDGLTLYYILWDDKSESCLLSTDFEKYFEIVRE